MRGHGAARIIAPMDQSTNENVMMSGYMEAALRSWKDADFKRRLSESPKEALAEAGWEIPGEVEVDVVFFDTADVAGREPPSAAQMTGSWAKGIETGNLRLAISNSAPDSVATVEIGEDELSAVGGGHCAGPYCVSCGL
jgi:hypothetical protein